MPNHYIPNIPEGKQLDHIRRLEITFAIGKKDAFLSNNHEFSQSLWEKGIWHSFYEWDGLAHRAKYWRQMLPLYL